MDNSRQSRLFIMLLFASFLAIACTAYLPALNSFFHADDFVLLRAVQQNGPFGVWSDRESPFLRPLISMSLFIDWHLWGLRPWGYHAANVFIHTMNAFLVAYLFPLLMRVFTNDGNILKERRGAVLSGLLFLLQPTHPEAVTWISGRTDVYAAFFCLLSLVFYLRCRNGGSRWWQKGALLLYGMSLLCKEAAIFFPFIIVAFEVFQARAAVGSASAPRTFGTWWESAWPFFSVVAVYLLLRVCILGKLVGGYGAVHTSLKVGPLFQSALWFSCSAFLPLLPRWGYCFAVLGVLCVVVIIRTRQKATLPPALGFLLVAFYLASAPVLTLGGGPAPDGMSGRLVYLASAFAAPTLVVLADFLMPDRRSASAMLAVLAGVFGLQLYALNLRWLSAGHIGQQCLQELASAPSSRRLVVLTVPDSLYPAFILRNGLPEAMRLFHPGTVSEIDVVSLVNLYQVGYGVTILPHNAVKTASERTFVLLVDRPPRTVQPGFSLQKTQGNAYRAELISDNKLQVTLTETGNQRERFFVFSEGELKPFPLTPVKAAP